MEEQYASKTRRVVLCECGRDAVEKVVGPRSPNRGLRYLSCDHFVFFGKKKNSCRFFQWIDQPRISKDQKKGTQALGCEQKEAASGNRDVQCARKTRSVVQGLENQCKTIERLQVNKENFEVEIRGPENGSPQIQTPEDVGDIITNNLIASQCDVTAYCGEDAPVENVLTFTDSCLSAEHSRTSPTNAVQPETDRSESHSILQHDEAAAQDVQGFNRYCHETVKEAHANIIQIGTGLGEVPKDKGTDQDSKQSLERASELLETPTCLCSKAAVLKTAKSKGPNQGLRFWVCVNSRPFYVKKKKSNGGEESCKFFRWVDTPFQKSDAQKDEEKQKRKEGRKRKELSLLSGEYTRGENKREKHVIS